MHTEYESWQDAGKNTEEQANNPLQAEFAQTLAGNHNTELARPIPVPPMPEPPFPWPGPGPGPGPWPPEPLPEPPQRPEPGPAPHPPRPSGDDGFPPGKHVSPPAGEHWGWQDPHKWHKGYDSSFFESDPNSDSWSEPIYNHARDIAQKMDAGETKAAANELVTDLYEMRGDKYAQDELINQLNNDEIKIIGTDLYLGDWNPRRGTWDDVELVPNDGSNSSPIKVFDYNDPPPWR